MLTVQREFTNGMVAVVDTPDRVIHGDVDAVRPDEIAFAPRFDELPVAVEDDDRMFAAIEGVHVVLAVRGHGDDLAKAPAGRQLFPLRRGFVTELAGADDDA